MYVSGPVSEALNRWFALRFGVVSRPAGLLHIMQSDVSSLCGRRVVGVLSLDENGEQSACNRCVAAFGKLRAVT